jgi:hypothetical protein
MKSEPIWDDWLDGSEGAIAVSAELASFIEARIEAFPIEVPEIHRDEAPFVARFGGLPLYYGWGATIAIRPDGQMVEWNTDGCQPVLERMWVVAALITGSKRYPELKELLPVREPGAVDCSCREHPIFASGKLECGECGGIGWLPAPLQVPPKRSTLQKRQSLFHARQ